MEKKFTLILIFLSHSFANSEVKSTVSFNNNIGVCKNNLAWQTVEEPEQHTKRGRSFGPVAISPKTELSCTSSFPIPVNSDFVIEATVFIKAESTEDFVSIYVYETDLTNDNVIRRKDFNASESFVNGFQTFKMDLRSHHGYYYVI